MKTEDRNKSGCGHLSHKGSCPPKIWRSVLLRDVVNTTTVVARTTIYEQTGKQPWTSPYYDENVHTMNQTRKVSGRSDLIQGNFVNPTTYRAYRLLIQPTEGCYIGNWRNAGYSGQERAQVKGFRGQSASGVCRAGLTSTYYPIVPTSLYNRARTQALNKAADQKMNIGESLAEIRSTAGMMAARLAQLVQAYRYARKGRWRKVGKTLGLNKNRGGPKRSLANSWLEYQFGWLPLMQDIHSGYEAIRGNLLSNDQIIRVQTTAVDKMPAPYVTLPFAYDNFEVIQGVQVGLTYTLSNERLSSLNQLGLANPLALAWDLLPLSFVVDWFISVGDFLSALSATSGYVFRSGYETAFVRGTFRVEYHESLGIWSAWVTSWATAIPFGWNCSTFAMYRRALQGTPPPGLYFKLGINNLGKALTALALVAR